MPHGTTQVNARALTWVLAALAGTAVLASAASAWVHWRAGTVDPDAMAQEYVSLALSLDQLRPGEVDAYFGPSRWRPPASAPPPVASDLRSRVGTLRARLASAARPESLRVVRLLDKTRQLEQVVKRLYEPSRPDLYREAAELYGIDATRLPEPPDSSATLAELDRLLPGTGALLSRMQAWRERQSIPVDKRAAVFEASVRECRRRTLRHWTLPPDESLQIVWTRNTAAAWHRYLGHHRSQLQVNPLAVGYLHNIIAVACHETYPGHHAQYLLREQAAGSAGLLPEDSLVLLRSTDTLILEGAATLAADLVFPPSQRLDFERSVLAPLAGLTSTSAPNDLRIRQLEQELSATLLPTLRQYHDGQLDAGAARLRLESRSLVPDSQALLHFTTQVGALVLGYVAVRDLLDKELAAPQPSRAAHGSWQALHEVAVEPRAAGLTFLLPAAH